MIAAAKPDTSDRTIAGQIKVDHKTVGAVRSEMEGRGEILHVEVRTDTRGREQPARKTKKQKPHQTEFTHSDGRKTYGDEAMADFRQAIAEEQQAEERAIAILVDHLNPNALKEFIACLRQCSMCVDKLEQAANAKGVWNNGDGLDIPDCLKRAAQ
jgi:hypothetical protein